jgi:non-ribosomal peptide synthase protein (TIGR01720 family)
MGISESPLMQEPYALDINGMVIDGRLNISFGYNTREYDRETVQRLADLFTENLREIVALCSGKEESEMTPGDLGYSGLGIEEFESLEREIAGDIGS